MKLPHAIELVPTGSTAIVRRQCWAALRFAELLKPESGKNRLVNPVTGEEVALTSDAMLASDWEIMF